MRKLWFVHLARSLVIFPGGFGALDELAEILTLQQSRKLPRSIPVLLNGSRYWKEIINFDALVRQGMISSQDLELFRYADDPAAAFGLLRLRAHRPIEVIERSPSSATPTHSHTTGRVPTIHPGARMARSSNGPREITCGVLRGQECRWRLA
jgi:hypothetical protein